MAQASASAKVVRARGGAVRVVVPADVVFNLDKFGASMRSLAERLGCLPCLSGATCQFVLERDFVVNPAGKVEAGPNPVVIVDASIG